MTVLWYTVLRALRHWVRHGQMVNHHDVLIGLVHCGGRLCTRANGRTAVRDGSSRRLYLRPLEKLMMGRSRPRCKRRTGLRLGIHCLRGLRVYQRGWTCILSRGIRGLRESRGRCMSRGRCRKIWMPLVYFMCRIRGRRRRSRLSCYRAVHCRDSRSEDPILERLLHRSSRNLLGRLGLEGPDVRVRRGRYRRRRCRRRRCCRRVRRRYRCRRRRRSGAGSGSCCSR